MTDLDFPKHSKLDPKTQTAEILNSDQANLLLNTQSVLLYSSKWNNNLLFRGKIHFFDNNWKKLLWSSPRDLSVQQIKLKTLQCKNLLTGKTAFECIKQQTHNSGGVKPENCLVLKIEYDLCVVFDQTLLCRSWLAAFEMVLSSKFSGFDTDEEFDIDLSEANSYGAIFDISESEVSDMWKEIKITFVNEDFSHSEFFNFDRQQKNLHDSSQEILSSVEDSVDKANKSILSNFLSDLIIRENLNRVEQVESVQNIKYLLPDSMKLKRKENSKLRDKYTEIEGELLGRQLINMILSYEMNDHGEQLADVFQLLFLQKLSIATDMQQLACEHQLLSMRKSLDVALPVEEFELQPRKSESPQTIQKRIEMIVKSKEKPSEKSLFNEPCECRIS